MSHATVLNPAQKKPARFDANHHCASCLYPLVIDEIVQTVCSHIFHKGCLESHLKQCPISQNGSDLDPACPNDSLSLKGTKYKTLLQLEKEMEAEDRSCSICCHPLDPTIYRNQCSHLFHATCLEDLKAKSLEALTQDFKNHPRLQQFMGKENNQTLTLQRLLKKKEEVQPNLQQIFDHFSLRLRALSAFCPRDGEKLVVQEKEGVPGNVIRAEFNLPLVQSNSYDVDAYSKKPVVEVNSPDPLPLPLPPRRRSAPMRPLASAPRPPPGPIRAAVHPHNSGITLSGRVVALILLVIFVTTLALNYLGFRGVNPNLT